MQPQNQPQYEITDSDRERLKKIDAAWKAYHGELEPPLAKMPGQPDDNVMSNRCQPIVDRGVDFLFGQPPTISAEEGLPEEIEEFLESIWGNKEEQTPLLQKLAMNGAIAGQAFLRIRPIPHPPGFKLVVLDPSIVYVANDPQDHDAVQCYCIEWCSVQQILGKPQKVYYREEITRVDPVRPEEGNEEYDYSVMNDTDATWQINHWTRIGDRGLWQSDGDPIIWPYPFAPIFSCQNLPYPRDFWGMPDVTSDLIGMNNALNLVESNINRVNKIYGQPVLYATGVAESQIDIKPGRIIGLPTPESKIVAVAITTDLANALQFCQDLRQDMDEQSSVPAIALGRQTELKFGQLSGTAIKLMFMPLLQKTEKKRCLYGELLINVSKALLILAKYSPDIEIMINWPGPLPVDDAAASQVALVKKQLGVSDATLLQELGYDPDEELEKSQVEDSVKVRMFSRGQGMPPDNEQQQEETPQSPTVNGGE